ncbi:MAG: hypothetical protein ACI8WT_001661 [Clostridium sp.]|jgi:hypothetical protein
MTLHTEVKIVGDSKEMTWFEKASNLMFLRMVMFRKNYQNNSEVSL